MCLLRCEYSQHVLLLPAPKARTTRARVATHSAFEWEGGTKVVREHMLLPALVTACADGESYWLDVYSSLRAGKRDLAPNLGRVTQKEKEKALSPAGSLSTAAWQGIRRRYKAWWRQLKLEGDVFGCKLLLKFPLWYSRTDMQCKTRVFLTVWGHVVFC